MCVTVPPHEGLELGSLFFVTIYPTDNLDRKGLFGSWSIVTRRRGSTEVHSMATSRESEQFRHKNLPR